MRPTLQGCLDETACRYARRRALGFYGASDNVTWLTYGELRDLGLGAGGWLRQEGLRRGDTCVLAVSDARRTAALLLGVLALGAIPLTLAPPGTSPSARAQANLLGAIARRARARLVLTDEPLEGLETSMDRPLLRDVGGQIDVPLGPPIDPVRSPPGDVASYQVTSGTTGLPRVCVWGQRAVVKRLEITRKALAIGERDLFVSFTPLHHTMGLLNNFFLCLTSGIPLVLLASHDFAKKPALWLRALSETRATETWSPNFGFALAVERIADEEIAGVRLDGMRGFWNAAERVHVETLRSFHRRFGSFGVRLNALKTNYGCAENVGGATFSDPASDFVVERVRREALYRRRTAEPMAAMTRTGASGEEVSIVSVGRPAAGVRIEIVRRGRRVPDGQVGEVALISSARMQRYLRDARGTRTALHGPRLMTGDLGYLRDGELFWTGRAQERITVRGKKIDPSDFEPVLRAIDGLQRGRFVAFGVDDVAKGTEGAVVVAEVRDRCIDTERIVRAVRAAAQRELGLALDDVVLVPSGSLVQTVSGKRRHGAYRERYREGSLEALRLR